MSDHLTADEAKQRNVELMGKDLGEIYSALWQEVAQLYAVWLEYESLYGTKESRVDLLNKAAPFFFFLIEKALFESIVLGIARLTDPPKSAGKSNLTIQRFPELVRSDIRMEMENLVSDALAKSDFCRDWRNRLFAHRDLDLSLGNFATPLSEATRAKINNALKSLAAVLDSASLNYLNATTGFDIDRGSKGALSLMYVLDEGLRARAERFERMRRGEASEGDYKTREL